MIRPAIAAVLLWAALAAAQQDLLARAQKALEQKDYPQAVALLREYLQQKPDDYRALFNLAYVYTLQGDRGQAIEAYTKTLAARPQLFEASLNLGILLLEDGRAREAVPHLAAAATSKPQHSRAALFYAEALARAGEHTAAIEHYGKALALSPDSSEAHLGLGRVLAEEKRYPQAEQEILKAMELSPKEPAARLELARVYELSGRIERAVETYAEYLKKEEGAADAGAADAGAAPVHRKLGRLYLEQKNYQEAAAALEQAARLAPAEEDHLALARAYAGLRRPEEALTHLGRLPPESAGSFDVCLLRGQMLSAKREFAAAQAEFQAAIRLRPDLPDAYVDLANMMYLQGRYPETIAVLNRLAAMRVPETPWNTFLRAITLDKLGQAEPALESYQRFLSLAAGKYPDQEFQARQRIKALTLIMEKSGKRRKK